MACKMQAKYFIWCLPEEVIIFPRGQKKLVSLDLGLYSIVLYFMRDYREFSRIVLIVIAGLSLTLDSNLVLCAIRYDFTVLVG